MNNRVDLQTEINGHISRMARIGGADEHQITLQHRQDGPAALFLLSRSIGRGIFGQAGDSLYTLKLIDCHLTDSSVDDLIRLVKKCPYLENVQLADNSLSDDGMLRVLAALRKHKHLIDLNILKNPVGDKTCFALADFIAHESCGLRRLNASHLDFTDEALPALAEAILKNQHLSNISLLGCNGGKRSADAMADMLRQHTHITHFRMDFTHSQHEDILLAAIHDTRNTNLLETMPYDVPSLDRIELNRKFAFRASKIMDVLRFPPPYEKLACYVRYQAAGSHLYKSPPGTNRLPYIVRRFREYLADMPGLPPVGEDFAEQLFRPAQSGFAPLDNPTVWANPSEMFERLAQSGVVMDESFLRARTPKGVGFLESAACMIPIPFLVEQVNRNNLSIGPKDLLTPEGGPSRLLQTAMDYKAESCFFSQANMQGMARQDALSVYAALPARSQATILLQTALAHVRKPLSAGRSR